MVGPKPVRRFGKSENGSGLGSWPWRSWSPWRFNTISRGGSEVGRYILVRT